jgi:predicted O-linked N-acetylglucosamine transferase (SPINDLY family)
MDPASAVHRFALHRVRDTLYRGAPRPEYGLSFDRTGYNLNSVRSACRRADELRAGNLMKLTEQAISLHKQGRLAEAEMAYRAILAQHPNQFDALHWLGVLKAQQGRPHEALDLLSAAVKRQPDSADALTGLAAVLTMLHRHEEALARFDQALERKPRDLGALFNRALTLAQLGRFEAALSGYDRALALAPDYPPALYNRANLLAQSERHEEALRGYDRVLALAPETVGARLNRGTVLGKLKRFELALRDFDWVLAAEPRNIDALNNRGIALKGLSRFDEALAACARALAIKPDHVDAFITRGSTLQALQQFESALASYNQALAIKSDAVEALNNRGNLFVEIKRYDEALASYDQALAIKPDMAEAWSGRGNAFSELRQYDKAIVSYDKALAIKPDLKFLLGQLLHSKMLLCDWSGFDDACARLVAAVEAGRPATTPMPILAIPSSSVKNHLECARMWSADMCPVSPERLWRGERYAHDRIRVAYLSADFRNHPVAHLLASLFERHDRARFETIAVSVGPDDRSEMRARLQGAFERFIDVSDKSDLDAARVVRELEADIAVDLMGSFGLARPGIVAFRPAPIQVNYLSYPGIVGTDCIDYIMADRFVIPEEERAQYSEAVAYLPDTYMGYDTKRKISERTPSRAELGLPERGFVFCAYNNSYKITPHMFDIWMRLLREVEGSVLWLYRENAFMMSNLRREAQARGVDPERLVFAQFVKGFEDHLARYRVVDLFLDAQPFNAVTTACDALWAGLPILTYRGETFLSRVATSLLHAVGLPEMVTTNLADYEALALKLARDPAMLAELKAKLARNRDTTPLFDTARFTRHIESAYTTMWEKWQRGEAPQSFSVAPIDTSSGK